MNLNEEAQPVIDSKLEEQLEKLKDEKDAEITKLNAKLQEQTKFLSEQKKENAELKVTQNEESTKLKD